MNIILIFFIAISLSMDAFSLSIAYGTLNFKKSEIVLLSIIVGVYHFFMPIFGMCIGKFIFNLINIDEDIIVLLIFSVIGVNMVIESFKDEDNVKKMKVFEMIIFGFAVSLDSFSIGIGLNKLTTTPLIASTIFSIVSFIFTYIGLFFGKKTKKYFGKYSTIMGGLTLIILGISYVL